MLPHLEPEMWIKNGELTIYYQYIRSNMSYNFEMVNKKMIIKNSESFGVHSATGNFEGNEFDFKKGELIYTTGNISEEEDKKEVLTFDSKSKSLSEFERMYEWEIVENKFL